MLQAPAYQKGSPTVIMIVQTSGTNGDSRMHIASFLHGVNCQCAFEFAPSADRSDTACMRLLLGQQHAYQQHGRDDSGFSAPAVPSMLLSPQAIVATRA